MNYIRVIKGKQEAFKLRGNLI